MAIATNLDSQIDIEKFDTGKIIASIRMLPDQIEQAWEEVKNIRLDKSFENAKNIVICGMGGSSLGGRITDSLLIDRVRAPIETSTEYDIPNYVNKDSLAILTSYSGNTEETVSAAYQAINKGAKIFIIATGGKLAEIAKREKLDSYIYKPKANPSGQPRMGLGYSIASTLAILSRSGFVHLTDDDLYNLVVTIRKFIKEFDIEAQTNKNIAKSLSQKLKNKIPILITSGHLTGVCHAFKNQLNENSKNFAALFDLPELNHHLLEGLMFPKKSREILHFLMIKSNAYNGRVIKRFELTADVIEKNGHQHSEYTVRSDKKIAQIFEVLTLSSFASFYLAYLNKINPSEIPWVDYFKKRLAKS